MSQKLTLLRGLLASAAWIAWVLGGYAYAAGRGPLGEVVQGLSKSQPLLLYGWAIVSATLLFFSIVLVLRGLGKRVTRPGA